LYAGDHASARRHLGEAVATFETGGFLLDGWHAGIALAEAEFAAGDGSAAEDRLSRIAVEAEIAGARLAAKLARETARRLDLKLAPPAEVEAEVGGSPRVVTGERMVSVLFADVRGYSQMAGRTAPAELADRISSLQRWATQEVERRHGIVDKFAGDAVMATFNVAGQSVDHTLQAVRAAIAIIDKAGLAGLPVGAGVAVGPAVVGNLATSANLSVLGDVTNLASRLQAAAEAGEVVFSAEVHRRVADWLAAQQIDPEPVELTVKGFPGPVSAYKVTTGVVAAASA
jgi:adenylate cyclase